jgi:hypothetical protein
MLHTNANPAEERRAALRDELLQLGIKERDLLVQVLDPSADGPQRHLGALEGLVEPIEVRAQGRTLANLDLGPAGP